MSDNPPPKKRGPKPKGPVYDPVAAHEKHKAAVAENVKRAFERAEAERIPSNIPDEQMQVLKQKVGRPSKYDPAFCDLVLEIMKQGKSIAAVACAIGVARAKLWEWGEANPEFRSALELGKDLSQQYWENLSQEMSNGEASQCEVKSKGNPGMVQFMMSRRFTDYHAKTQASVTTDQTIKQTQTVFVFESQLAEGVIRQKAGVVESQEELDKIIDEISEDEWKQEFE